MKCYNHADKKIVGFCSACGRGICGKCVVFLDKMYCKECAEKGSGALASTTKARWLCARCAKSFPSGFFGKASFTVTLESGEENVCGECYVKLKGEYRVKKACDDCVYLHEDFCKKIGLKLSPVIIGEFDKFFIQAEKCVFYMTKKDYEEKALRGEKTLGNEEKQVKEKEIVRETVVIYKVRCPYCDKLYDEALDVCPHCGGKR